MTKSEVLEELYGQLPDREADRLIDMILEDDSALPKAEAWITRGNPITLEGYNLFAGIKTKPIYRTVAKFMEGGIDDPVQTLKMLSSVLTQIFIQCELRDMAPSDFSLSALTDLILDASAVSRIDSALAERIKTVLSELGFGQE